MKPTGAFNLSKSAKRLLMAMPKSVRKGEFKKLMIQAELEYEWNKKYGSRREKVDTSSDE